MMRGKKGFLMLTAVILVVVTVLAGCSSNKNKGDASSASPTTSSGSGNASAPVPEKLNPVTLKIIMPGDKTTIFDETKAEVERQLADTLNVKLDVVHIPWADLAQKTQVMLASGEAIDLIFDAPWLHLGPMVAAGYYEELSSLLEQYGPNIIKTRPQAMWDANKVNGQIMGIPLGIYNKQPNAYSIRKDLREELGLPEIKTYDELINFVYKVKEKRPNMYPLIPAGDYNLKEYAWVPWNLLDDSETNIRATQALPSSIMLYYKNNDGKVHNLIEEMDPKVEALLKQTRKLYEDKIIHPDVLTNKDDRFYKRGEQAVKETRFFGIIDDPNAINDLKAVGGEVESVRLMDLTKGKRVTNFVMDNFIAIPKNSKNKERAIQFLDWANQKDNYDLLEHGIPGKHWEPVGEDKWRVKEGGAQFAFWAFALNWNPTLERLSANDDEGAVEAYKLIKSDDYFIPDITTGFSFDAEPVKNEIAQYTAIEAKHYMVIMNGVADPFEGLEKFNKEAGQMLKKIQDELQKQVDAFIAAK